MSITQTINLERDYLMAEEKLSAIDNYYYQEQIKLFSNFADAPKTILAMRNLLLKNYVVIGSGGGGVVLKSVNQDIVIKIGKTERLSKEIDIIEKFNEIQLTPQEEENKDKLPFVQYGNLSIVNYTTATLKNQFPELFIMPFMDDANNSQKYHSFSMPFLGKDFMEFYTSKYSYNHFTAFWCCWDKPTGTELLRVSELQMYTLAWIKLIDNVTTLHNHNYIHGDIKENNLIYKAETNEFILIDFDHSQNINNITESDLVKYRKKIKKHADIDMDEYIEMLKIDDIFDCILVYFRSFIYYSFGNLYIYEQFYNNKFILLNENGERRETHFIKTRQEIKTFINYIKKFVMDLDINAETVAVPNNTFSAVFSSTDKDLRISPVEIKRKLKVARKSKVGKRMSFFSIGSGKKTEYDKHSKTHKRDNKIQNYHTRKL